MTALWQLTAGQLTAGFGQGSFTPSEALSACVARCDRVNPRLNALVAIDREGAAQAARASDERWRAGNPRGPLDGVPVTIKDNLQVHGLPTHWGSQALAGYWPKADELPVARLREAGAVIFGKTNVPEFTMQGYTDNRVFGVTGNPWDPALTPGGSSGGAAALVAAGGCPIALATDGGGSIRRPASHTHLVGLKPSRGRVPRRDGLPPIFLEYEVVGPLARCVADAATVLQVIGNAALGSRTVHNARILHIRRFGHHPVDPLIERLTDEAARELMQLGHRVDTAGSFDSAEAINQRWPLLSQVGLAWLVRHSAQLQPADSSAHTFGPDRFGPAMRANAETGERASAVEMFDVLVEIEKLRGALERLFEDYDFLLTPAAAALPWPAGESHPTRIGGQAAGPRGHAVFTAFANAAGLPAIAVPCGFAGHLPVGLQLIAPAGADDRLLALAGDVERLHGWQRFPEW